LSPAILFWIDVGVFVGGIFISYRGDDSDIAAALIDRELTARFGSDLVFLDCRSIPVGMDFVDELLEQLRACKVLLVVMGPRWLNLVNKVGERRIDSPTDWVRREIAEALAHGLRVIPVLLDSTTLPVAEELPHDIAGLSRRQYVPLRRRHTNIDLTDLAERIIQVEPDLARAAGVVQESQIPSAALGATPTAPSWTSSERKSQQQMSTT
jgi:TIR domain